MNRKAHGPREGANGAPPAHLLTRAAVLWACDPRARLLAVAALLVGFAAAAALLAEPAAAQDDAIVSAIDRGKASVIKIGIALAITFIAVGIALFCWPNRSSTMKSAGGTIFICASGALIGLTLLDPITQMIQGWGGGGGN